MDKLADLVMKTYGASHGIAKSDVWVVHDKKKVPYFDDDDGSEGGSEE